MDRFDDAGTDAERCEEDCLRIQVRVRVRMRMRGNKYKRRRDRGGELIVEGRNGGFLVTRGNHPKTTQEFSTAS